MHRSSIERHFRLFCIILCFLMICLYQLGLINIPGNPVRVSRQLFYSFWTAVGSASLIALLIWPQIARMAWPTILTAFVGLALEFWQYHLGNALDPISKSFIVSMFALACTAVLCLASSPGFLVTVIAANAACLSVICLVQGALEYYAVFGRSPATFGSANIAAEVIVISVSSCYHLLNGRWKLPLLLLSTAGIFMTLSKTMVLATGFLWIVHFIQTRQSIGNWRNPGRAGALRIGSLALFLIGWIAVSLYINPTVSAAVTRALNTVKGSYTAIIDAQDRFESLERSLDPATSPMSAISKQDLYEEFLREFDRNSGIDDNSIAVRVMLLKRALTFIETNPIYGGGITSAFMLGTHNTFLTSVLAFGPLGLVVPLALLALAFRRWRETSLLAFPVAVMLIMLTSHDLLFNLSLIVPLATGLALRQSS